jgi:hypothetical protein
VLVRVGVHSGSVAVGVRVGVLVLVAGLVRVAVRVAVLVSVMVGDRVGVGGGLVLVIVGVGVGWANRSAKSGHTSPLKSKVSSPLKYPGPEMFIDGLKSFSHQAYELPDNSMDGTAVDTGEE